MSTLFVDTLEPNQNTAIDVAAGHLKAVGSVVQTVSSSINYQTRITSSSYVDTNLAVSITPKFNTSKIFICLSSLSIVFNSQYVAHRLLRDSTEIYVDFGYNNQSHWQTVNFNISHLDSPATTSTITYKTQGYVSSTVAGDIRYNYSGAGGSDVRCSITAMEIAQ